MFEVPVPIKKVFDTFPLYTYNPIPNTTPSNIQSIESNKFYFTSSNDQADESACFTLGVHNIYLVTTANGEKKIPSDPISLGHSLILCHKNGLQLPTCGDKTGNKSKHSIMKLSYHASPDNQLPILIEDDLKSQTRNIRSALSMNQSVKVNNKFSENALARIINELVDAELADLWILCLLSDLPSSNPLVFNKLFRLDEEITNSTFTNKITIMSILNEIPKWGSFKTRYSYLFDHSRTKSLINMPLRLQSEDILEVFANTNNESIRKAYNDKLKEFEINLELLIDYIENESSDQKKIIELKLVGFVIIIDSLLDNTELHAVISKGKFSSFVKLCYEIIGKY
ncbi:uncharacterized protein AC631_00541 [Debaryomyces fabryi]|uniref:Sorting assembly machinery 35 kDa subunit n=1 Tax=Debaryomyces fabryi TaxID=58627 RepID=A0A0V1Q5E0_9ASCO|nr:uncharacterized protein AC631_00541 [Debaryomyces fabryi]KSA03729.1 hypothetical protein AC631_00541 [Debaryomyces fabryi]CUM53340.1 unnamed protein product [Debaryomyces fabryi]